MKFFPQTGPFSCKPFAFAGERDILTRESTANEVDWFEVMDSAVPDISVSGDMGPVFFEDSRSIIIYLHLPSAVKSHSFQAKIHAPNAGEKAAKGHAAH